MLSEASYHNMTVGRIPSVEGGIQPTIVTTKGDIIVATGNASLVRQGVGANGTVLTANSAQADGVEWAALPASGKVLQVVYTGTTTRTASSSTTYGDTALTASITPTSSSSTVLVFVSHNGVIKNAENSQNSMFMRLLRDATELAANGGIGYTNSATRLSPGSATIIYRDSPATTSSITYKTQIKCGTASSTVAVNDSNDFSSITLFEIGA